MVEMGQNVDINAVSKDVLEVKLVSKELSIWKHIKKFIWNSYRRLSKRMNPSSKFGTATTKDVQKWKGFLKSQI